MTMLCGKDDFDHKQRDGGRKGDEGRKGVVGRVYFFVRVFIEFVNAPIISSSLSV